MTRRLRRGLFWGALLAALGAGLVYAFWPQPVPVDLGEVTRGPLAVTVDEEGETQVKDVYLVSAPVGGRLLRIEREVGDWVEAGETLLAAIQPADPAFLDVRSQSEKEAAVRAAEAARDLAEAEANAPAPSSASRTAISTVPTGSTSAAISPSARWNRPTSKSKPGPPP